MEHDREKTEPLKYPTTFSINTTTCAPYSFQELLQEAQECLCSKQTASTKIYCAKDTSRDSCKAHKEKEGNKWIGSLFLKSNIPIL